MEYNDEYLYNVILLDDEKEYAKKLVSQGFNGHMAILSIMYNNREEFRNIFDNNRRLNPDYVLDEAVPLYIEYLKKQEEAKANSMGSNVQAKTKVISRFNNKSHSDAAFIDAFILCLLANLTIFLLLIGILFIIKMN